ncbi:MAG TPA: bL27 family ribosomal protein [Candidatus Woesebacteria bacterium]|nr:bL27 family ribosomal protein [Candidatus Woesebacteria bacterium]
MAHTKAQRAVKGNRDSISKRRGVKLFGGQKAIPGNIIVRQKGTKVRAGEGVILSRDFTLVAKNEGTVTFYTKEGKQYVKIVENEAVSTKAA